VCSAFLISEDWTVTTNLASPRRWASLTLGAEHIGVSDKTMRRMIASGQITGYRVGPRLVRVDLNELDALLADQTKDDLKAERLAEHVKRVVDAAPPLSPAQRDKIAALLRGGAA
jgi:excisionase family DNA binding protein